MRQHRPNPLFLYYIQILYTLSYYSSFFRCCCSYSLTHFLLRALCHFSVRHTNYACGAILSQHEMNELLTVSAEVLDEQHLFNGD